MKLEMTREAINMEMAARQTIDLIPGIVQKLCHDWLALGTEVERLRKELAEARKQANTRVVVERQGSDASLEITEQPSKS